MNYIQNKHRKTYDPEFKLKIVDLYLSGEKSVQQLWVLPHIRGKSAMRMLSSRIGAILN